MKKFSYSNFCAFQKKIIAREKNQVKIQPGALLSIALVFPNTYAVGMANLGFQAIYRLFNEFPGVRCERMFLYKPFPETTKTLESGTEIRNFDVIAFSIAYELDFPNLVQILINAGITPFSADRHAREPLVMAGGAITFMNPTPIEPFVDFFYSGEIEPQLSAFLSLLLQYKKARWERTEILERLHEVDGIYVPQKHETKRKLKRIYLSPNESSLQYSPIISPNSHFQNMFLIEVGRGCGRHCNFCAASHIYHPFRIFSPERILNTILTFCHATKRVGLIGAALSDYPRLVELTKELVDQGFELGLSSFRLDMITPTFLEILEQGKIQTLTFAPEAGTERLRDLIHKNLSDQQIFTAASAIAESRINKIKLYFMIGLPGEREEDIEGIVDLVRMIQKILAQKKKRSISVSVNTFIPKSFTPFQWCTMATVDEIRRKRNYLEKELKKIPGLQFIKKSVKEAVLQGIFSMGNKKVAEGIYYKIKNKVDWQTAWQTTGIDVNGILYEPRKLEDELPWDFMEYGLSKVRLWRIWKSAHIFNEFVGSFNAFR